MRTKHVLSVKQTSHSLYEAKRDTGIASFRFVSYGLLLALGMSLSACSSYTTVSSAPVYTIPAPKPSLAKIRAHYIHRLQADGVQVIKLGETMRFVLLSDCLFKPDSANLRSDYRPTLKALARLMKTYDKVNVQVAAYTDNNGHIERQQALTTRQAQVVASFLWSRGINARLAYAVGYNRKNPVDYNGSSHGRFNNRRVEISFRFYPEYVPYA
ncbi:OmpA family protein [Coxiella burnetii]|uniref:OmpA family protein n=1 Tax=Coxiella burnetii TaxID=777 RepID=UPI000183D1AE|nr:OmpA family protein [Coxiella burnetii]ACJ20971.1 IcmN protein, OmpA family [Coxiella burnetii CbuK_Q154]EAX33525.3 hypothetical protein A35_09445 [Coxiella burnetii 'MSU Goat Q177']UYK69347.1 OmpA family protein [Coxiella burnetii]